MPRPLLLSCEAVSKAFGSRSLFDGLTFGLFEGDQAGLVGPNGSGKSTLLKILAGVTTPDAGARSVRGGVRVGYVPQDPVFAGGGTVADVVRAALDGVDEEDRPGRVAQALGRAAYQESLANTVRREIEWLRRGAKARSTKAKGRIKEAARLIDELQDRRARGVTVTAGIDFVSSQRRTRRLLVARGLTKSLGGRRLVSDLDLVITPGTRIGLIGPNGSGKTTLLDLLAGARRPDAGAVERAENLSMVRFEQERGGLDPTQSLRRALAPEGDAVTWQGRSIHVASWAKRFLFRSEQLEVPVGRLSGGEQAR